MKSIILILQFTFFFGFITSGQLKEITLEDIYEKGTFTGKGVPGFNFTKDGLYFTRQMGPQIIKYEIKSGNEIEVLFNAELYGAELLKGKMDSYSFVQCLRAMQINDPPKRRDNPNRIRRKSIYIKQKKRKLR